MARRRPLHTCASTCVGIAQRACKRIQDLDYGPLGSTTKRAINSFLPIIYTILYPILTILSIVDDQILTFETKIEKIVPQSTYLFDKIDILVCSAESLPQQIDNVFTKIPSMIHHFPFLDRILIHLISCLNLLVSILTHLGSKNMREKEIRVDMNCKTELDEVGEKTRNDGEFPKGLSKGMPLLSVKRFHSWKSRMRALEEPHYAGDSPMYSTSYQSALSSPVSDSSPDAFSSAAGKTDTMNCSYKEILERGTKDGEHEQREENLS